jgi:hypothetical protein
MPLAEYHRLAVSYGLSFSEIDIGSICRPSENEDIDVKKLKVLHQTYRGFDYTNDWSAVKD